MNILIYKDEGADSFCVASLVEALEQERTRSLPNKMTISWANRHLFKTQDWKEKTALLIFPGGRDTPYHRALKGMPAQQIIDYVKEGGSYLGICAGAYFGSAFIGFEEGQTLQVIGSRELKFFPGKAQGPAYGLGQFCYRSEKGAKIARLKGVGEEEFAAYYNGGCAFMDAKNFSNVTTLASYADIPGTPSAIIQCSVGRGQALLSGIHPEYSAYHICSRERRDSPIFMELREIESARKLLFSYLIRSLLETQEKTYSVRS